MNTAKKLSRLGCVIIRGKHVYYRLIVNIRYNLYYF